MTRSHLVIADTLSAGHLLPRSAPLDRMRY